MAEQNYRRIFAKVLAKNILRLRGEGDSVREVQQAALDLFGKSSTPHNCHVEMSFLLNHAKSVQQGGMFGDAAGLEWNKEAKVQNSDSQAGANHGEQLRRTDQHSKRTMRALMSCCSEYCAGSATDATNGWSVGQSASVRTTSSM